jgi:hypothetical protein
MNGGTSTSTAPTTPAAAAADENSASASTDVLGGMMEQKKWGPQGGAPMFNTPNCRSFNRFEVHKTLQIGGLR